MFPSLKRGQPNRGVTFIELMVALAIVAMMSAALGALTRAARISSEYTEGVGANTQHARVALERISRNASDAYANESFPGCAVFGDSLSVYSYPDTLVIWVPSSTPANPTGLPRFSELVVYCPNPSKPNELLEITSPGDQRDVPALNNTSLWNAELTSLKTGNVSQKTVLTDLLRTAKPTFGSAQRGAARFVVELRPSAAQWASYRAGSLAFKDLFWAQSIYGAKSGLRQTWLRCELQLVRGYDLPNDPAGNLADAFFGSAATYWSLQP